MTVTLVDGSWNVRTWFVFMLMFSLLGLDDDENVAGRWFNTKDSDERKLVLHATSRNRMSDRNV